MYIYNIGLVSEEIEVEGFYGLFKLKSDKNR